MRVVQKVQKPHQKRRAIAEYFCFNFRADVAYTKMRDVNNSKIQSRIRYFEGLSYI